MSDFSPSARAEIRRAVRSIRGGRFDSTAGVFDRQDLPGQFILARASATYLQDQVGDFNLILKGTDKGDETADTDTVPAYVRAGLCLQDKDYLLLEVAGADDAAFDVLNPTRLIVGKADSAISKSTTGTISVYSGTRGSETDTTKNITAYNRMADIASGAWVLCEWSDWYANWEIIQAECSS